MTTKEITQETRTVSMLWQNDAGMYHFWIDQAQHCLDIASDRNRATWDLAERMKEWAQENLPELACGSIYADLLTDALGEVDWNEIADDFVQPIVEEGA